MQPRGVAVDQDFEHELHRQRFRVGGAEAVEGKV